jgi:hypothetical protein
MSRRRWIELTGCILLMVLVPLAIMVAMAVMIGKSLNGDGPDIQVLRSAKSPDRRYIATYSWISGGGAAGFSYFLVSVSKVGMPVQKNDWVVHFRRASGVQLRWKSNKELQVIYAANATDIRQKPPNSLDVRVTLVCTTPPREPDPRLH